MSTRTAIVRFGVAGFIRSAMARATSAKAITQIARTAVPVAEVAKTDRDTTKANMNTSSVPPVAQTHGSGERTLRIALPLLTISWLLLGAILVMSVIRIQRWEMAPGEASAVSPRIGFMPIAEGGAVPERFVADNGIKFVTAFGGQLSILDSVMGWLDPHVKVQTHTEHFGEQSPSDSRRVGFQMMFGAKQVAEYVAMKKIGLDANMKLGTVVVADLVCDKKPRPKSACKVLEVGDTVTHVDGVKTATLPDLAAQLATRKAGDIITLTVIPYSIDSMTGQLVETDPKSAVKKKVELIVSPDNPQKAIVGFVPADTRIVTLPFEVSIATSDIGGPSAGLAFTLALIDELTKGNLTGTRPVAATGTMNTDGTVGSIGALEQKAIAVRDSGAHLFLVPAGQSDEEIEAARKAAGSGVRIVKVTNLDQALKALRANGGDPLPARK